MMASEAYYNISSFIGYGLQNIDSEPTNNSYEDHHVNGFLSNRTFSDFEQLLWKLKSRKHKGNFDIFVDSLNIYFIPAIIITGICGNILSALVFTFTHLRRLTSSLYLTWLSMADVSFLLALGVAWLDRVGVHWFTSPGWCQIVVYLTRVCGCLSVWLVFSFTLERYVIVHHALRRDMLCTRHKAKVVIASLCCASVILYTYIFVTYDVMSFGPKKMCGPNPKYHDVMTVMTCINTTISCIVPCVCIVIFNIKIIFKLHDFQKQRMNHFTRYYNLRPLRHAANFIPRNSVIQTHCSNDGNIRFKFSSNIARQENEEEVGMISTKTSIEKGLLTFNNCPHAIRYRSQLRTARMLLALSSIFVLFNLPSQIFHLHALISQLIWNSIKTPRIQYKVHEFFEIFFFLNFAINFFVYSLCGHHFRTGLKQLHKRVRHFLCKSLQDVTRKLCSRRKKEIPQTV